MNPDPVVAALGGYRAAERRRLATLGAALGLLALCVIADIATGPALLPVGAVVQALAFPAEAEAMTRTIVWSLRLPMALMAVVVGVALGASGAGMQTLLDNPLASPYTLGLAAAAGFGAALAIQMGGWGLPPWLAVPGTAFLATTLAAAAITAVGALPGLGRDTMVLAGIALLFLFHALTSLLQFRATPETGQQIVFWLFGSLAKATWSTLAVTALACAAALPYLYRNAWRLTALHLGEARARALGIDVGPLRVTAIAAISLMTATAISFVGTIGFVGLIAPHLARMLVGADHRFLLPLAAICGALMLSAASVASKLIMPGVQVPVGIITALVGLPFFVHLIITRRMVG